MEVYIVKVKKIVKSTILTELYDLQEISIIGVNNIQYKLTELTKISKLLTDEEISERKERLNQIALMHNTYDLNKQLQHLKTEEVLLKFKEVLNRQ